MNLQTFKAATMAEALTQVKSNMGSDAVILHTRTFYTRHWLGLRRREMVEITAGKGLNVGNRRKFIAEPAPSAQPTRRTGAGLGAYRNGGSGGGGGGGGGGRLPADRASLLPPPPKGGPATLMDTPGVASAAVLAMTKEMSDL